MFSSRHHVGLLNSFRFCSVALLYVTVVLGWPLVRPTSQASGLKDISTLEFLVVVSRHGTRSPLFTYPTYPYPSNDTHFWPYGEGQLTAGGRVQMFNLGKRIRTLYNGLLNRTFYQEDFKAFSTVFDRTLMSGQSFLAGIFPPEGFQVWNQQLLWQPVPLFPTYLDNTKLLMADASLLCERFAKEQKEQVSKFEEDYKSNVTTMLANLHSRAGLSPNPKSYVLALRALWDPLVCAEREGLPLPPWADSIYPEPLGTLMAKADVAVTIGSDTMIRLLQGKLFQEIAGLLKAKVTGSLIPDRKMYYYSGHDMTIRGLQGVLGLRESGLKMINTGSALLFELHRNPQSLNYSVKVLYIDGGSTSLEPSIVDLPICGSQCEFEHFMSVTEKYFNITDYEEECKLDTV